MRLTHKKFSFSHGIILDGSCFYIWLGFRANSDGCKCLGFCRRSEGHDFSSRGFCSFPSLSSFREMRQASFRWGRLGNHFLSTWRKLTCVNLRERESAQRCGPNGSQGVWTFVISLKEIGLVFSCLTSLLSRDSRWRFVGPQRTAVVVRRALLPEYSKKIVDEASHPVLSVANLNRFSTYEVCT